MFHNAQLACADKPAPALAPDPFELLVAGHDLNKAQTELLFSRLVAGELTEAEMAAMLVALRLKGETADELAGAASALRSAAAPFLTPSYAIADCCGTGADGSGSFNVSTAVAFAAAACGLPVAKHGNRSVTSRCGSADVMEALGARIDLEPAQSRQLLDELGFCFLFAPQYHPGLRHAGPVRRRLNVRTIMNFLGPCLNPARPSIQLLGVADPSKLIPVAMTLDALGVSRALVVHGAGLDEIALHDVTNAALLADGDITEMTITPEDAGLARHGVDALRGGDPETNAEQLKALLHGAGTRPQRDVVAINCGALLMTAGLADDIATGAMLAAQAIESGAAGKVMDAYVEASHG